MFKSITFLGLCLACLLSLGFAFSTTNSGQASNANGPGQPKAHTAFAVKCPIIDVAVDEGYGVSRMEKRKQCVEAVR
jgi:hypothetical protein